MSVEERSLFDTYVEPDEDDEEIQHEEAIKDSAKSDVS